MRINKSIEEINEYSGKIINPLANPEQIYELYSVPSFENGCPEIIKGKDIGSSKISIEEGDILICKINPRINRVWVVEHTTEYPLVASSEWIVIRNKKINANYLKWYFSSPVFRTLLNLEVTGIGGSLTRAQPKQVAKYKVPIPNEKEQNMIADSLDKIMELITLRQQQLSKLDELVKARFVELFGDPEKNTLGWKEQPLSEHLSVIGGYAFKSEQFSEEGIPVLRIGNINSGFFKPVNLVFWEDDDALNRYKMYPGDLVMSLTGTVGKDDYGNVCILGNDYTEYYLNQRNAKLELQDTMNKYYLSMLLKFEPIKKKLTGISRGVRQANISNKDILNLSVPIPPIELQNQFATFVKQTDKSKLDVQKSLEQLETLKKALMQQYFG